LIHPIGARESEGNEYHKVFEGGTVQDVVEPNDSGTAIVSQINAGRYC